MKIAIVVPGRFHAFDLGRALLRRGHDVTLFTNYPKWAVKRFGFPEKRVRSCWVHGVIAKGIFRFSDGKTPRPERWLNPFFGSWASKELSREHWDVVHSWSGVSEEILRNEDGRTVRFLMRGSSHIRAQYEILRAEEQRTGIRLDCPDEWIRSREQREYELAQRVVVLSSFARDTFVAEGVDPARMRLLLLGANTEAFSPTPDIIESRCQRILSGEPLRVLYVGALSLRKGLLDAAAIARKLRTNRFRFRFIGPVLVEARQVTNELKQIAEVLGKKPQRELPTWYSTGDIFIFPTLEDGFPVALAQAQAAALPILTTPNGSGPDLISEGETGWVLPIRSPEAFVERLLWCDTNRSALAEMVRRLYRTHKIRNWDDVATDFEALCVREATLLRGDEKAFHG
jgi:glycosyltransferase involved in cell wall biosynthesis